MFVSDLRRFKNLAKERLDIMEQLADHDKRLFHTVILQLQMLPDT